MKSLASCFALGTRFQILASFAEQESVSLSNNIKWTFQKKFRNGEVHSHQKMLGYRWEGDERLVVPEEAEIVRFIFSEYLAGKSYYQACSGLSPPSYCPCRAY